MQVGAEDVRVEAGAGLVERGGEAKELTGKGDLARGLGGRGAVLTLPWLESSVAEDGANADGLVEEVGRGVTFEGQHFVPREPIVHRPTRHEVGIA